MKFNVGQPTAEVPNIGITIRRLGADDDAAVTRLAQLDTARRFRGELMGAELTGTWLPRSRLRRARRSRTRSGAPPRSWKCCGCA
jgi:hypothetical protein